MPLGRVSRTVSSYESLITPLSVQVWAVGETQSLMALTISRCKHKPSILFTQHNPVRITWLTTSEVFKQCPVSMKPPEFCCVHVQLNMVALLLLAWCLFKNYWQGERLQLCIEVIFEGDSPIIQSGHFQFSFVTCHLPTYHIYYSSTISTIHLSV